MTREQGSLLKAAIAAGLAALIHAGALAWALGTLGRPGAIAPETAAISLNLIETLVLDAPVGQQAREISATNFAPAAKPQPADRPKPVPEMSEAETEAPREPQLEARRDADEPPPSPNQEKMPPAEPGKKFETKSEHVSDPPPRPRREIKARPRKPEAPPATEKPSAKKNAQPANSRGQAVARRSEGRVSASRGEVRNYGALVRTRIAKNRPGGRGTPGTVIVAFAISRSGALRYARVNRTSGNMALDRAALAAVRRAAPFPDPPKAMSLRQLSYTLPFRFK